MTGMADPLIWDCSSLAGVDCWIVVVVCIGAAETVSASEDMPLLDSRCGWTIVEMDNYGPCLFWVFLPSVGRSAVVLGVRLLVTSLPGLVVPSLVPVEP